MEQVLKVGGIYMYFQSKGAANTGAAIELALKAAEERGIEYIVAASNTGNTAKELMGKNVKTVCVTHVNGFIEKGKNEMPEAVRAELEQAGVKVLTASHVLSGVERGISRQSNGMYPAEIIANALRMFGQGTKVCVEISIMALDAGLIPYGQKVIAVGGSGRGADTAVVITPAHASEVFDTYIHEIICKPV